MGDAGGTRDGGGITERAGGIGVGGCVYGCVAMAGLLAVDGTTMYHVFMNYSKQESAVRRRTSGAARWDFLTNHAHVLICAADDPGIRLRDIAAAVGITERASQRILSELVEEGYVLRERARPAESLPGGGTTFPCVIHSSTGERWAICSTSYWRGERAQRVDIDLRGGASGAACGAVAVREPTRASISAAIDTCGHGRLA